MVEGSFLISVISPTKNTTNNQRLNSISYKTDLYITSQRNCYKTSITSNEQKNLHIFLIPDRGRNVSPNQLRNHSSSSRTIKTTKQHKKANHPHTPPPEKSSLAIRHVSEHTQTLYIYTHTYTYEPGLIDTPINGRMRRTLRNICTANRVYKHLPRN